jgi:hypothetical protein
MNGEEQVKRHSTCEHRSPEKVKKEIKACCGRVEVITEFWCKERKTLLTSPICWNCEVYKKKEVL